MQITLTVNTEGAEHKIQAIVDSLEDLKPALAAFNLYKRKQVQEIFDAEGPGWLATKREQSDNHADVAEKRIAASKQLADQMLRKKLKRDVQRAQKRELKGKGTAEAVARRYAVLKEFERLAAGGSPTYGTTGDAKLDKSVHGLRNRMQKAHTKVANRKLGRMASSIQSKLTKYDLTIQSIIPWSQAHNKGATVGHGAKLPQRQFLDITDQDIKMLIQIIEDHTRFNV